MLHRTSAIFSKATSLSNSNPWTGAMLEWGYIAVEIEPVQGLELESDVALEKIADVRWSIHATRVGQRWQCAIPSRPQGADSSSASKRPLRSQRRIIPEPSLVGLSRSFVVQIP